MKFMNGRKRTSVRRERRLDWEGVREKVLTTEFKQKQGNQAVTKRKCKCKSLHKSKGGWEGKLFIHYLKSSSGPWVYLH